MSASLRELRGGPWTFTWRWLAVLAVVMLPGAYGLVHILFRHEPPPMEWGTLVPCYVFFALAATGCSLVNSIFTVFGVERFRKIAKRGVLLSVLLILPPLIFICVELGKPFQMYNLYIFFQPHSRMSWMGTLYMVFLFSLVVELVVMLLEESLPKWVPRVMGSFVLLVTLAVHTNLGALFGSINAKPMWSTHLLPMHFIVSAVMSGAAIHILFGSLVYIIKRGGLPERIRVLYSRDLSPLVIGLIIVNFALIAEKIIASTHDTGLAAAVAQLTTGGYAPIFWGFEIIIGGIVPLVILLNPKTRNSTRWLIAAAAMLIMGVFVSKYDLVVGGQSVAVMPLAGTIPYWPEFGEILFVFTGAGLFLMLFTLGEILLPLDPEEEPRWLIFPERVLRFLPDWLYPARHLLK